MKLLPIVLAAVTAVETQVSPIQKVIQMLGDMQATGQKDLDNEQVEFAKFKQFCGDTTSQKAESLERQTQEIESLSASKGEFNAQADEQERTANKLNADLGNAFADKKNITEEREAAHKAYLAEHRDFSESVDALDRALIVLKRQSYDRKQAFLQTDVAQKIPEKARVLVQSYLALKDDGDDDFLNRSAPEANAYEFQGGGIVDLLEKLQAEFTTKVSDAEKAEVNGRHAFELASQDLADIIEQTKAQLSQAQQAAQSARASAASASKSLDSARVSKSEDVQFLKDLRVECSHKEMSFIEKQKLRQDELEALGKAVEILGAGSIAGAAAKRNFLFLQESRPWAIRVSEILQKASEKFKDTKLALLAASAQKDQFSKVKKMIASMINRLLEEANAEAEKKGFCDKELKVNKQTREKLQDQYDVTAAELEQTIAEEQKLTEAIAQLQSDITFLDQQRATTTEEREQEKTRNAATIQEAKEAQVAVASARNVIADFYAKAGTATAFIQLHRPTLGSDEWNALANPDAVNTAGYGQGSEDKVDKGHREGMQTFGENYKGQQDSAGGVLSVLSIIASDFSNLQADTEASEAQAQAEFETFMADTQRDKAVKGKQVEMKTADAQSAKTRAHTLKQDLNGTDDELRAANRYFDNLKPQCLVTVSYEERVKRREEEIESLKEALEILKQAAAPA